jgi:CRISPR/Cas system CSM-associated protein Csm5 (group 7 of RAMP superfamily)
MSVINEIKTLLGMEVKLAQMKLENGTVLEADAFEMDMAVFIVNGEDRIAVPVGEYKLEDGNILKVDVEGIIAAIEMPEEEMPEAEEEVASPAEEEVVVEANAEASPKKIVESITKEMFFSEIEKLRNEIAELKGVKLSADEEDKTDEDLKSKEVELSVEPLTHSPEVKAPQVQKFASNRQMTTQDRVMAKLFK